jgi:hypothetical protein
MFSIEMSYICGAFNELHFCHGPRMIAKYLFEGYAIRELEVYEEFAEITVSDPSAD